MDKIGFSYDLPAEKITLKEPIPEQNNEKISDESKQDQGIFRKNTGINMEECLDNYKYYMCYLIVIPILVALYKLWEWSESPDNIQQQIKTKKTKTK